MTEKDHHEQLKRSSLGRIAFIGELYDVRTESLSSLSLLPSDYPKDFVRTTGCEQMEFHYKFTESSSDRFELIDVETELQLSVLFGLITVEGSGKFLSEEKKSGKSVSCSLKCQIQTKNEKFFGSLEEYVKHVDLKALEDPRYTHVITEINWGANCLLSLEFACSSDCEKKVIEGQLAGEFAKLKIISVKGGGRLEKLDTGFFSGKNMNIKVFADVVPEGGWPTTVESFFEFIEAVPGLLSRVNEGKGKPLNYTMVPLSVIRRRANLELAVDFIVRKIDESFITSTIYYFEEVGQTKQKFHDLYAFLYEWKQYVREEDLNTVRKMKAKLTMKESELKSLISEHWVLVRSGEENLNDLVKLIERFKNQELRLYTYEEYLESCSAVVEKLSSVGEYRSRGVVYLCRGENFSTVQSRHPSSEFVVMVTSSEMQAADPELHRKTLCYFLAMVSESKPDTKYTIVDLDVTDEELFASNRPSVTKCFHLKGTQFLSRDLFRDYEKEMEGNFVRPMAESKVVPGQHKPGNRVTLNIPCPGFQACKCSSASLSWECYACRTAMEYGFDKFCYCSCGRIPLNSLEYRCGNASTHGNSFVAASADFLEQTTSKLRPLKEMNVLVIGQSGVGKSTWINSIVNYLSYQSFDTAEDRGVICTIPAEMTLYDPKTFEKHEIKVGELTENEVTDSGHSATQTALTYTFLWDGICVRIIDTPGLGDTRGINQDKRNLNNIIEHIGYLKELHGVCILLKSNDNRFNAIFTYCIKELLVHLHKSVTKNIVFCFTNSRTSLYSPGQSSVVLEKVIQGIGVEKELALGRHNMFSLDNEAFVFLCSLKYTDIEYEEIVKESFKKSWDVSFSETVRLFEAIKTFEPHLLKETLSLVTARSRVLSLTKPIAEVSKTIQVNVTTMERKKKEIESSNLTIEELLKKLTVTVIELEPVELPRPRTVCTSSSCVLYHNYQGTDVTEIEYKTHCHPECYLKRVTPKTVNNPELKECYAMSSWGTCNVCGCSWDKHMHLTYHQKRVEKTLENKFVKENITREESEKEKLENLVKDLMTLVEKYNKEQEFIIQTSVKFGMFLKDNAISVYNDSIAEYLEYLIDEEKKKPHKSATEKEVIRSLEETLHRYNCEVQILTEVLKKNEGMQQTEKITAEEVYELEKQLYGLELMGEQIRQCVELSRSSTTATHRYMEVPIQISANGGPRKGKEKSSRRKKATNSTSHNGATRSSSNSIVCVPRVQQEVAHPQKSGLVQRLWNYFA